jgi:cell division protein FtsL
MSGSMILPSKGQALSNALETRVVKGRFARVRRLRQLRRFVVAGFFLVCGLVAVGSLSVYALRLSVEQQVSKLSQDTRNLDEMNKALAITVNREQSFLQITEKANRALPRFQASAEVIDVPLDKATLARIPRKLHRLTEPVPNQPGF